MSKLNQIQRALVELDGGVFQKLSDAYLHKRGYANINAIGSVVGANKVRMGTPDTYLRQPSGKLIFFEHTTDQSDIVKKLNSDLDKCLDFSKTGVQLSEIEEVVFCHNSNLSLEAEQALYKRCQEVGIKIQTFGVGAMSFDLYQKYPFLAQEFLGISVDTGQIVDADTFVSVYGKNQTTTPLDTDFYFREEELKETIEAIENNCLIILSGSAGVGKSRLALEATSRFIESNTEFRRYVIFNKGTDVFQDIKSYFSSSDNFIIIVDDANRVTQFDYIIDLIQNQRDDQNIKVLATVRDYASEKICSKAKVLESVSELKLELMQTDQIKDFVKSQFGINNTIYLERIAEIAGGNPRLSVMAASIAIKENSLSSIQDVSELYDKYFSSITNDLEDLENTDVLKVAGIIAFFRNVDRSNQKLMSLLYGCFEINSESFWNACEYLHSSEIVDIYEDEVVKISDQVLSTYLFYLCFFKLKKLNFSVLINEFFPSENRKLKDAVYPCISAFDSKRVKNAIRYDVEAMYEKLYQEANKNDFYQFVKAFWFILESKALLFIRESIIQLEAQDITVEEINFESKNINLYDHPLLEILALYSHCSNEATFKSALELVFQYIEKKPYSSPQVIKILTEEFGFSRFSHNNKYLVEKIVVEALWGRCFNGKSELFSRLFIEVASYYLKTDFRSNESTSVKEFTMYRFRVFPCQEIFNIRKQIWNGLFELNSYSKFSEYVLSALDHYMNSRMDITINDIVKNDSLSILPFIENQLNPDNFSDCLRAHKYIDFLKSFDISTTVMVEQRFSNEIYDTYKLLSIDYSDLGVENYSDYEQAKKEKIKFHTQKFGIQDYKRLIEQCSTILKSLGAKNNTHRIQDSILNIFMILSESDQSLYMQVFGDYIKSGDVLNINHSLPLIKKLVLCHSDSIEVLSLIQNAKFENKTKWLFDYYQSLELEQIFQEQLDELLILYASATQDYDLPYLWDYLENYKHLDADIFAKIIRIILTKVEEDIRFASRLGVLFYTDFEANRQLLNLIKTDINLVKKVYLAHYKVDHDSDYHCKTLLKILEAAPEFIRDIIYYAYETDRDQSRYNSRHDYKLLWTASNYAKVVLNAIEAVLEKEGREGYICGGYLEIIFCVEANTISDQILNNQDKFLKQFIAENYDNNALMELIFLVIANFKPNRRVQFIELFLSKNKDLDQFKELSFEPMTHGWTGSAVPVYQARADFWSSILPLCNTVELLDHKLFVEQNIQNLLQIAEREKKSDFIDEI